MYVYVRMYADIYIGVRIWVVFVVCFQHMYIIGVGFMRSEINYRSRSKTTL